MPPIVTFLLGAATGIAIYSYLINHAYNRHLLERDEARQLCDEAKRKMEEVRSKCKEAMRIYNEALESWKKQEVGLGLIGIRDGHLPIHQN